MLAVSIHVVGEVFTVMLTKFLKVQDRALGSFCASSRVGMIKEVFQDFVERSIEACQPAKFGFSPSSNLTHLFPEVRLRQCPR